MTASRTTLLLVLLVGVALSIQVASLWRADTAASASNRTHSSASEAIQLSQEIKTLRTLTPQSDRQASEILPLAQLAEQAAQTAGLPPEVVDRVTPEPTRSIKDTPYTLEPTTLVLRDVSLQKLPGFIKAIQLSSPADPLTVDRIRLIAPRQTTTNASQESWDIETTLTRKTYAPVPRSGKVAN